MNKRILPRGKTIRRAATLLLALALLFGLTPAALAAVGTGWDDDCRGNPSGDGYGRHNWVKQSEVPGNGCTSPGTATYRCANCGANATRETKAPGHKWGKWKTTQEATCTSQGQQTRKCSVCGKTERRKTDRAEHSWGGWTVTREATCAGTGSRERTCRVCGERQTETIEKLPHTWSEWEDIVPVTDHSPGTRRHTCEVCGAEETETVDPEGTLRPGSRGDEVQALQAELICCGALNDRADGVYGKKTEQAVRQVQQNEGLEADGIAWPQTRVYTRHLFGDWQTVTKLTRESDGLQERVCARCGAVEREEIQAVPSFRRGDRGKPIEFIQNVIWDLGYKPGTIDGIYGPILDRVVGEWARDHDWYFEPGLMKPIIIDHIIGDWVRKENPAQCSEGTPVQLSLRLTPAVDVQNIRVGQTVKYYWTAINYGEEDCTLGPIMYSFGKDNTTQDVQAAYRFVADIDGNLLKANGENTLTGSLTFVADRDLFEWEAWGFGTLYLNVWAIGTSRETGRKWRSWTETARLFNSNETDLLLTVELIDPPKDGYAVDEEVSFRWTLTNRGDAPCTVQYVSLTTPDDQGEPVYDAPDVLAADGGSVSGIHTTRLIEDWRYRGCRWEYYRWWWIYFEARAQYESGPVRANEVHFQLPEADEASELIMTVEEVSPKKAAYAPGDEVTFHWTLANAGTEELKLDYAEVDAVGDDINYPYGDQLDTAHQILPPNGEIAVEGDYTLTLTNEWMYHGWLAAYDGGCRLRFYAYADSTVHPETYPVRTDSIDIFLPGKPAERELVLTVEQISPKKERYVVGEEVVYGWSLTNLGDQDRTLECIALDFTGGEGFMAVYEAPRTLYKRGGNILTGTFTCELSEDMMLNGEWRFDFFTRCHADEEESYVNSNHIIIEHKPAED